jgi:hypothetical protein
MIALILAMLIAPKVQAKVELSTAWDVPAVSYWVPALHPCNIPVPSDGVTEYCITGPELHWKCSDSARILLTSEDGNKHCILFPPQVPEVITMSGVTEESK